VTKRLVRKNHGMRSESDFTRIQARIKRETSHEHKQVIKETSHDYKQRIKETSHEYKQGIKHRYFTRVQARIKIAFVEVEGVATCGWLNFADVRVQVSYRFCIDYFSC
jgi:hypothetical protein